MFIPKKRPPPTRELSMLSLMRRLVCFAMALAMSAQVGFGVSRGIFEYTYKQAHMVVYFEDEPVFFVLIALVLGFSVYFLIWYGVRPIKKPIES